MQCQATISLQSKTNRVRDKIVGGEASVRDEAGSRQFLNCIIDEISQRDKDGGRVKRKQSGRAHHPGPVH